MKNVSLFLLFLGGFSRLALGVAGEGSGSRMPDEEEAQQSLFAQYRVAAEDMEKSFGKEDGRFAMLLDYLKVKGKQAVPVAGGFRLIDESAEIPEGGFAYVVVTEADSHLAHAYGKLLKGNDPYEVWYKKRLLLLRGDVVMSPEAKAAVLYCALYWCWRTDGLTPEDVQEMQFTRRVLAYQEFRNKIFLFVGGKPYLDMVNEVASSLIQQEKENGRAGAVRMDKADCKTRLEKIFGSALSDFESEFRIAQLRLQVAFRFADAVSPTKNDAVRKKAFFLGLSTGSEKEIASER